MYNFPDLTPLFWMAAGALGALVGVALALVAWIVIPAGAWMLAVVGICGFGAAVASAILVK